MIIILHCLLTKGGIRRGCTLQPVLTTPSAGNPERNKAVSSLSVLGEKQNRKLECFSPKSALGRHYKCSVCS